AAPRKPSVRASRVSAGRRKRARSGGSIATSSCRKVFERNTEMTRVLIVAEHLGGALNASTARCVTCAKDIEAESMDVIVLAADAAPIAALAAKIDGVSKVLAVSRPENAHPLAAVLAP